MKTYVLGFLFSEDRSKVLLIRKHYPKWQRGLLNGIGGKIEANEQGRQAMRREFREEAGLTIDDWEWMGNLYGIDWKVFVYRAFGDVKNARSCTRENIEIVPVGRLPPSVIPNTRWLIPICLDEQFAACEYVFK